MSERTPRLRSSLIAAGTLSALTLVVFFLLQNFGPESALRRFHMGVASGDQVEMDRVSFRASGSNSTELLAVVLRRLMGQGAHMRIGRVERSASRVVTQVDYVLPGQYFTIWWIVEKRRTGWLVNSDETLSLWERSLGAR